MRAELSKCANIVAHVLPAGGGSDGNTTAQLTATLDGLGAIGDGAHAVHETVLIDGMVERAALLAEILLTPVDDRGAGPA